jgi:hypothetical protein
MVRADPHCRLQNDPPPRAALALKHGAHRSGGGSEGKDRVLIAGAGIDEGLEVEEGVQPYDFLPFLRGAGTKPAERETGASSRLAWI